MTRRHDLDWIRVLAFLLLVLYHVGMYYVSWDWHVKSPRAGPALEPLMLMTSPWRLSLLFLVSGVATAFLVAKASAQAEATDSRPRFLGSRSWRLLVPLLFGMLVVVPPQSYYEVVEKLPGGYQDGYLAFWARYLAADDGFCRNGDCLDVPTWNHLWFVAYLWVYSAALGLLSRLAPTSLDGVARRVSSVLASPTGILLWPILYFSLVRLLLVDIFPSTHALVDDWYNHAQFLGIFVLGFLIARADGVWNAMQRMRWIALALWAASWVVIAVYVHQFAAVDPPQALRATMRAAWGLNQWCAIVAALGMARHWNPQDSPLLRYLTIAVFPFYILHQTVIVVLAHSLKPLHIAPALEGPLLIVATFALCLLGYEIIRRVPLLRPLFGLKRAATPPRQPAGAPQPAG